MELTYLYILAEEAELTASHTLQCQTQNDDETPIAFNRDTKTANQPVDSATALDCDRTQQPYPTFYL